MHKCATGLVGRVLVVATVLWLPSLQSSWAGGPYDGTYHGTLSGASGNAVTCAKRAPIQITVTDSRLEYHNLSNSLITAPVAADGSFSGSAQNMYATAMSRAGPVVQTLTGKITGTAIQAETKVGTYCTYELALKRF